MTTATETTTGSHGSPGWDTELGPADPGTGSTIPTGLWSGSFLLAAREGTNPNARSWPAQSGEPSIQLRPRVCGRGGSRLLRTIQGHGVCQTSASVSVGPDRRGSYPQTFPNRG